MRLHEDKALFKEVIEAAAQHFRLRPVFIEKDYWVTYVLRNLALSKFVETVIFKGGTSLIKPCMDPGWEPGFRILLCLASWRHNGRN